MAQMLPDSCNDPNDDLLVPTTNGHLDDEKPNIEFISIVDKSLAICQHFGDAFLDEPLSEAIHIKSEPMRPLTMGLMKRKPFYYMGLKPTHFFRLVDVVKSGVSASADLSIEAKIMLALRKHRLNEDFEALGDWFDIDEPTTIEYCTDVEHIISNIYDSVATATNNCDSVVSEWNDEKHSQWTVNIPVDAVMGDESLSDEEEEVESSSDEEEDNRSRKPVIKEYVGYVEEDSDIDSEEFEDSESSESFSSDSELSDEANSVRKIVKCPVCSRLVHRLAHHMEISHLNHLHLNETVCGLCFAAFRTYGKLREHQLRMHKGKACVCDVCGEMFGKVSTVKEHIFKVHLKRKPFPCHYCKESYGSSSQLEYHISAAHTKKLVCEFCPKEYCDRKSLRKHCEKVHGKKAGPSPRPQRELSAKKFSCELCPKEYCDRSGLRRHRINVHGKKAGPSPRSQRELLAKKFSCELCPKEFCDRSGLRRHRKNVHGKKDGPSPHPQRELPVKKFSCELCPKEYCDRKGVRRHSKKVHDKNVVDVTK